MAKLQTKQDLINYSLRRLGEPVINIEVDALQTSDRVDDAIQYFLSRHYDGVEEVYIKQDVSYTDYENGYISLNDRMSSIIDVLKTKNNDLETMDNVEYQYMQDFYNNRSFISGNLVGLFLTRSYLELMSGMLNAEKAYEFNSTTNRFYFHSGISPVGSSNASNPFDSGKWVESNCTLTNNDAEIHNGNLEGSTIKSSAASVFSITDTYTTTNYVLGKYTAKVYLKKGTYAGNVNLVVKDRSGAIVATKTVTPTTKWTSYFVEADYTDANINDLVFTIESSSAATGANETLFVYAPAMFKNAIVVLRGYRTIDEKTDIDIYDNEWVKRYTTALIKRQWGGNLSKFEQVQLPSGITVNGTELYNSAQDEIDKLEIEFQERYEEPALFFMG